MNSLKHHKIGHNSTHWWFNLCSVQYFGYRIWLAILWKPLFLLNFGQHVIGFTLSHISYYLDASQWKLDNCPCIILHPMWHKLTVFHGIDDHEGHWMTGHGFIFFGLVVGVICIFTHRWIKNHRFLLFFHGNHQKCEKNLLADICNGVLVLFSLRRLHMPIMEFQRAACWLKWKR